MTEQRPRPTVSELIEAARQGSGSARNALLIECRHYLLPLAARELHGPLLAKLDAADVAQEALLLAHENFAQFRGETGEELLAWTRRILQNCIFAAARRFAGTRKRDLSIEVRIEGDEVAVPGGDRLIDQDLTPSSHAMAAEEARAIEQALASLPPAYQTAIRMRYWERRSLEEIGAKLRKSPEAARKLYVRAVRKFVKNWQGRG